MPSLRSSPTTVPPTPTRRAAGGDHAAPAADVEHGVADPHARGIEHRVRPLCEEGRDEHLVVHLGGAGGDLPRDASVMVPGWSGAEARTSTARFELDIIGNHGDDGFVASYQQYCPVARACEILTERWSVLIVRNLMWGASSFTELAQGVPHMSRSMLIKRLRELERNGIVVATPKANGQGSTYALSAAGHDLAGVVAELAGWAERWVEVRPEHTDPGFALWVWCRVQLDRDTLPPSSVVIGFTFPDEHVGNRRSGSSSTTATPRCACPTRAASRLPRSSPGRRLHRLAPRRAPVARRRASRDDQRRGRSLDRRRLPTWNLGPPVAIDWITPRGVNSDWCRPAATPPGWRSSRRPSGCSPSGASRACRCATSARPPASATTRPRSTTSAIAPGLVAAVYEHRMRRRQRAPPRHARRCERRRPPTTSPAWSRPSSMPLLDVVAETDGWYARFLARTRWDPIAWTVARRPARRRPAIAGRRRRLRRPLADLPRRHPPPPPRPAGDPRHRHHRRLGGRRRPRRAPPRPSPRPRRRARSRPPSPPHRAVHHPARSDPMTTTDDLPRPVTARPPRPPRRAPRTRRAGSTRPTPASRCSPCAPTIGAVIDGVVARRAARRRRCSPSSTGRCSSGRCCSSATSTSPASSTPRFAADWGPLEAHPFIKRHVADQPDGDARGRALREGRRRRRLREHLAQRRHLAARPVARLGAARHRGARRSAATRCGPTWAPPTTASHDDVKERIDGLTAVHDWINTFGRGMDAETRDALRPTSRPSSTRSCAPTPRPAARRCTSTGAFTQHIVGLDPTRAPSCSTSSTPGRLPRVPVPLPLGARRRRLLGQPLDPALRRRRTTSRSAG